MSTQGRKADKLPPPMNEREREQRADMVRSEIVRLVKQTGGVCAYPMDLVNRVFGVNATCPPGEENSRLVYFCLEHGISFVVIRDVAPPLGQSVEFYDPRRFHWSYEQNRLVPIIVGPSAPSIHTDNCSALSATTPTPTPASATRDLVRVFRLLEYTGDRLAVESVIQKSIHGSKTWEQKTGDSYNRKSIGEVTCRAITVSEFPEPISSPSKTNCSNANIAIHDNATAEDVAQVRAEILNWIDAHDPAKRTGGGQ